jgi:hypothetical protein
MTPFEVVYGKNTSSILTYRPGVSKVQEVNKNIIVWEAILHSVKENLAMA